MCTKILLRGFTRLWVSDLVCKFNYPSVYHICSLEFINCIIYPCRYNTPCLQIPDHGNIYNAPKIVLSVYTHALRTMHRFQQSLLHKVVDTYTGMETTAVLSSDSAHATQTGVTAFHSRHDRLYPQGYTPIARTISSCCCRGRPYIRWKILNGYE